MDLGNQRPAVVDHFALPRRTLSPEIAYLERSGLITITHGNPCRQLARAIAVKLSNQFGWSPDDYRIFPMDDRVSNFLIICLGPLHLENIIRYNPYVLIAEQVHFTITKWTPRIRMDVNRGLAQAWITLRHLPLQAWTDDGIANLVSSFGVPEFIQYYGLNARNFEKITLRILTHNPRAIPHHIRYRSFHRSTLVLVQLHEWRPYHHGYYAPPAIED
jgi:hypothetical protein